MGVSRLRRRLALVAIAASLIGLMPGASGPVLAADPTPAPLQERAVEYWTEARIRGAVPRDLALAGGSGPIDRGVGGLAPAAALVDGAPWTAGGAILQRSGVVLFTLDGGDYRCSGSIVQDAGDPAYSLVITAAHCAHDEFLDVFATNWVFIPAWALTPGAADCTETTYGCWAAHALVIHEGWADEESLTVAAVQHDYAIAVVGTGGHGTTQLDALGAYPIRIGGLSTGDQLHAFGYPAQSPYDGDDLVYCDDNAGVDFVTGSWGLTCDMTGGASGGPWLYGSGNPAGGSGEVASVSSYRKNPDDGGLYGPRFDAHTRAVYEAAKAAKPIGPGSLTLIVSGGVGLVTPFTDINGSTFKADIEWLYLEGITTGCSPTTYCPKGNVTREQMAGFLVRALDLPPTGTDYFTDDETSTFEGNINALRAAGITTGCSPTTYCPKGNVTREQMAGFLHRALDD
jgi:S-layer homology domain